MSRFPSIVVVALLAALARPAEAAPLPWWNAAFAYRQGVTVTAQTVGVPAGYALRVDLPHAQWIADDGSLASGDDVRVVRWDGLAWTELDRVLDTGGAWAAAKTQLWFKTVAPIAPNQ